MTDPSIIAPLLLLTRPPRETRATARALAERGFASLSMPLQYTRRARKTAALEDQLRWAEGAEIHIFVSRSSVTAACCLAPVAVAAAVLRFAVGRASAEALARHGFSCNATPTGTEDSEGLLSLPALGAIAGRHIAVWVAPGGRELIADRLRERGAEVRTIAVYQRVELQPSAVHLSKLRSNRASIWLTATSATLAARLAQTLRAHDLSDLLQQPLIVASERIAIAAERLGFERVYVAPGASPEALIAAVEQLSNASLNKIRRVGAGESGADLTHTAQRA